MSQFKKKLTDYTILQYSYKMWCSRVSEHIYSLYLTLVMEATNQPCNRKGYEHISQSQPVIQFHLKRGIQVCLTI